jgi:hypothetical protein
MTIKKTYLGADYKQPKLWNINFKFEYLDGEKVILEREFSIEYSKPSQSDIDNAQEGFELGSPEKVMAELDEKIDTVIKEYTEIEAEKAIIAEEFNNLLN